jgi:hypothetical protein
MPNAASVRCCGRGRRIGHEFEAHSAEAGPEKAARSYSEHGRKSVRRQQGKASWLGSGRPSVGSIGGLNGAPAEQTPDLRYAIFGPPAWPGKCHCQLTRWQSLVSHFRQAGTDHACQFPGSVHTRQGTGPFMAAAPTPDPLGLGPTTGPAIQRHFPFRRIQGGQRRPDPQDQCCPLGVLEPNRSDHRPMLGRPLLTASLYGQVSPHPPAPRVRPGRPSSCWSA